jgi:hypothetical protein
MANENHKGIADNKEGPIKKMGDGIPLLITGRRRNHEQVFVT